MHCHRWNEQKNIAALLIASRPSFLPRLRRLCHVNNMRHKAHPTSAEMDMRDSVQSADHTHTQK